MTVSTLLARIKNALADAFPQRVTVVGEISNFKRHGSGHLYFRLKDAGAALDATMWRSAASRLKFAVEDGMEVVAEGRVDIYEVQGRLQFYVERMTPKGVGALELAFQQLCEKLQSEGLFDPAAKKPIPRFPRGIGIITSATGAAVRDISRTLARRWPGAKAYLLSAAVQGDGAGEGLAEAVRLLDASAERLQIDTLIIARGGGSLEDLWAFNEEVLARALFAAETPIICGVGHEVDVTIADMVADLRAPTPTGAAELAVGDCDEIRRHMDRTAARLAQQVRDKLAAARSGLDAVMRSVVFRDPTASIRTQTLRVDELAQRLRALILWRISAEQKRLAPTAERLAWLHPARLHERTMGRLSNLTDRLRWALGQRSKRAGDSVAVLSERLAAIHPSQRIRLARQQVESAGRQLEAMSYRSVLQRGFSVTRDNSGNIIRSVEDVRAGEAVETQLTDGKFRSVVDEGQVSQPATNKPAKQKTQRKPAKRRSSDDSPTLFE